MGVQRAKPFAGVWGVPHFNFTPAAASDILEKIYQCDISIYYIVMREYTPGEAICQVILVKFTTLLVILTEILVTCQYTDKIMHICCK
jgi:hypothetical protein